MTPGQSGGLQRHEMAENTLTIRIQDEGGSLPDPSPRPLPDQIGRVSTYQTEQSRNDSLSASADHFADQIEVRTRNACEYFHRHIQEAVEQATELLARSGEETVQRQISLFDELVRRAEFGDRGAIEQIDQMAQDAPEQLQSALQGVAQELRGIIDRAGQDSGDPQQRPGGGQPFEMAPQTTEESGQQSANQFDPQQASEQFTRKITEGSQQASDILTRAAEASQQRQMRMLDELMRRAEEGDNQSLDQLTQSPIGQQVKELAEVDAADEVGAEAELAKHNDKARELQQRYMRSVIDAAENDVQLRQRLLRGLPGGQA